VRIIMVFAAAAAAALIFGVIAPAAASTTAMTGGVGIRLVPYSDHATARDRAYLVANPDAGSTVRRTLEVSNTTTATQDVTLYPGAASIRDGAFIGDAVGATNDLTEWTTLEDTAVTLAAGETERLDVEIGVPASAASGERYGAIWAAVNGTATSGPVSTVNRAGVRMYVNVGNGAAQPAFTIRKLTASPLDGRTDVIATVENTGSVAVDLIGELHLAKAGLTAGPYANPSATTITPGGTDIVRLTAKTALPAGKWNATATLTSGALTKTASTTITVPGIAPVKNDPHNRVVVGAVGTAAIVALVGIVAWVLLRRRQTRRERYANNALQSG
jgi:hypothetical protein